MILDEEIVRMMQDKQDALLRRIAEEDNEIRICYERLQGATVKKELCREQWQALKIVLAMNTQKEEAD